MIYTVETDFSETEEGGEQTGPKKPSGTFAVFKQEVGGGGGYKEPPL